MDSDVIGTSLYVPNFQNNVRSVRTYQRGRPLAEVSRTDRVAVGVENVGPHKAVLQR